MCGKCGGCFSRWQVCQESWQWCSGTKIKDEKWKAIETPQVDFFFPREFPQDLMQGSLFCASIFHLSSGHYRQYFHFFGVCNQDWNLDGTLKLWKLNALSPSKLFSSSINNFFWQRKKVDKNESEEKGVNRLKGILPPFQKAMHISLNWIIWVGYGN